MKEETNNKLPFLDILIMEKDNKLCNLEFTGRKNIQDIY